MLTRDSNSGPDRNDKIIDLVDDDNKTSLCRAQEGGRMDIYKILLDGQTIKAKIFPIVSIIYDTLGEDVIIVDPPSQGIVESEELKFFEDRNISDDRNTGNKYVDGFPEAVIDFSKESVGCVMYEVEVVNENTFGDPLRVGWTFDQRTLLRQGENQFVK